MKRVIIAEKPSVARNIAAAIGARNRKNGWIESDSGDIVTWCLGHLVELKEPQEYDPSFEKWSTDTLPILPSKYELKATADGGEQFAVVSSLLSRPDIEEVVCATDADREGELIFRYVMELSGCKKPASRLWVSSQEPDPIREGLRKLRPDSEYDGLSDAAHGRSQADWAVGMNLTRLYSCLYGAVLNCGRVQTPVVAELVRREDSIANFKPAPYWNLTLSFEEGFSAKRRFDDAAAAKAALEASLGASGTVVRAEYEDKTASPPRLYSLTALQKDAASILGMTAKETLDAAQSLYEKKLSTYPRTDSRFITPDLVETAEKALEACVSAGLIAPPKGCPSTNFAAVANASKVESHPALLPTPGVTAAAVAELSADEACVLALIAWQLAMATGPKHVYKAAAVDVELAGEVYEARGRSVLEEGWRAADETRRAALKKKAKAAAEDEKEGEDEESGVPFFQSGACVHVADASCEEKATKPPSHHTETSILSFMATAGKDIDDEDLRAVMRGRGIGTSATRGPTIDGIVKKGFAERKGSRLLPTEKGRAVTAAVAHELREPETTARWESLLSDVESGNLTLREFMSDIEDFVRKTVAEASVDPAVAALVEAAGGRKTVGTCPKCGAAVVEKKRCYECSSNKYERNGESFELSSGCGFRMNSTVAGKKLPAGAVKSLLEKGACATVKGFVSKKGTKFDARLKRDGDGRIEFVFDDRKRPARRR